MNSSVTNVDAPGSDAKIVDPTTVVSGPTSEIVGHAPMVTTDLYSEPTVMSTYEAQALTEFFERPVLLGSHTVSSADAAGATISSFFGVNLYLTNPAVVDKLKNFKYCRFKSFQVIGVPTFPPGTGGAYVISTMVNGGPVQTGLSSTCAFENCLQVDHHAKIDVAASNTTVNQMPFTYQYDVADINSGFIGSMFHSSLFCLAPVTSGVGSSATGTIKFYGAFVGMELYVPTFQGEKIAQTVATRKYAPRAVKDKPSVTMKKVAGIAEAVSTLPVIGRFAVPVAAGASLAATVLDAFGFTRKNAEAMPISMISRSTSNVAVMNGEDSGNMAALDITNAISLDPTLVDGVAEDQLDLEQLCSRFTFVKRFAWSSSATSGTELVVVPISPFLGVDKAGVDARLALGPAGYFGLNSTLWRADCVVKIVFPFSKFHRGTLQLYWYPSSTSATGDITNITKNMIYSAGDGDLEIEIAYSRDKPMLSSVLMNGSVLTANNDACNGNLFIRVVNPLVAQTGALTTVQCSVFTSFKNVTFGANREALRYSNASGNATTVYSIQDQITLQGGAVGDEECPCAVRTVLVPPSGDYDAKSLHLGETWKSVRAMLQKPSKLNAVTMTAGRTFYASPFPAPRDVSYQGKTPKWTYCGYFAAPFIGVAGSERWKLFVRDDAWVGATREIYDTHSAGVATGVPNLSPMTFSSVGKAGEITVPYYGFPKYIPNTAASGSMQATMLVVETTQALQTQVVPYVSYGSDVRVGCFRQIPLIVFEPTAPAGTIPWFTADV